MDFLRVLAHEDSMSVVADEKATYDAQQLDAMICMRRAYSYITIGLAFVLL